MSAKKLTPEVRDTIVADVERGVPLRDAARLAGVSQRSAQAWLAKGREFDDPSEAKGKDRPYADFAHAFDDAESRYVRSIVMTMEKNRLGGRAYNAEIDLLSRKRPDDFGKKDKVEHAGGVSFNVVLPAWATENGAIPIEAVEVKALSAGDSAEV